MSLLLVYHINKQKNILIICIFAIDYLPDPLLFRYNNSNYLYNKNIYIGKILPNYIY